MKKTASSNIHSSNKPFYMQKWVWIAGVVLLAVILLFAFKGGEKSGSPRVTSTGEYTVEITGTYAIGYNGQIISGSNVLDIKGILLKPAVYTVQGSPVIVNLEKPGQTGTVKVEIKRGNAVLETGETSSPYGKINITAKSYY